jgi:hypothetical protein
VLVDQKTSKSNFIPEKKSVHTGQKKKSVSQSVPVADTEQQLTNFCEEDLYQHWHKGQ